MKKKVLKFGLTLGLILSIGHVFAQQGKTEAKTDMFPEAKTGMKKVVVSLPTKKNEHMQKVEIFIGKQTETDACNKHFLIGQLKQKDLSGWGYNYFEFEGKGDVAGTLMACPDSKTISQFVATKGMLVDYNSKLPLVIYIPQDLEVKYRFWKADKKIYPAK